MTSFSSGEEEMAKGLIEQLLSEGFTKNEIKNYVNSQEKQYGNTGKAVNHFLKQGEFGSQLLANKRVKEFKKSVKNRDLCYCQIKDELQDSEESIKKGVGKDAVINAEQWVFGMNECHKCGNDFFFDEKQDERYCPVCCNK